MHFKILLLSWVQVVLSQKKFVPKPGYFPETGDDTIAGGIFCISLSDLSTYLARNGGMTPGPEAAKGTAAPTAGTGPYAAHMFTDPSLPKHTMFAPKTAPNVTMPFIAWANGYCGTNGAGYQNMLLEIASHGYFIVADGAPSSVTGTSSLGAGFPGMGSGQSKWSDMVASLNWAEKGGANKYGQIDLDKIITAGHSCGGLEAMSVAYHNPKVKQIILFNIAIFHDNQRYLLSELKAPVTWFIGGPKDMGYSNANKDYDLLPNGLPAYKASLDTGHMGTFFAKNGGKSGKAAVNFLEWRFRGSEKGKAVLFDSKSPESLASDHWNVTFKNWS